MKIHEFDPVIYPRKLWIVVTNNPQVIKDNFEYDSDPENFFGGGHAAMVISCSQKETNLIGVCICFTKHKHLTTKNIAHESVHAASYMFSACNMSMGFEDGKDEHYAYLVGWIAECCEKVKLNKK